MSSLAVIDQSEQRELAALLGTSDAPASSGDRLPILTVNSRRKDPQGRKIEEGKFFLKSEDEAVYADNVKIRVLSQLFQWIHFDNTEKKVVNRTIQIPNFRVEPRDQKGTLRCGKPTSKVLNELGKAEQKKYEGIKCNRILRVLVSYEGKDADGNSVTVENKPAIMFLKGANFSPFEDEYVKTLPRGANFYDYWCELSAEELENGSVTYYVMHFKPDLSETLPLDQDTYDTMVYMAQMIKRDNDRIESAYQNAIRGNQLDDDALDALEGDLADDLDD